MIKNYLEKLRALPDKQKKAILWAIVAVLVIVMGYFWIKSAVDKLNKLGENVSQIKFPEIELPKVEITDNATSTEEIAD